MYAEKLKAVLVATKIRITLNRVEKIHLPLKEVGVFFSNYYKMFNNTDF